MRLYAPFISVYICVLFTGLRPSSDGLVSALPSRPLHEKFETLMDYLVSCTATAPHWVGKMNASMRRNR